MKSEATRASIILLHLSVSPSPPSFHLPSPIHCDTSDVWALSEWVWWWRRLLPSIVGNVRISLHCCKYGVCLLQPPQDRVRWKFLPAKWRRNICHGVVIYLFIYLQLRAWGRAWGYDHVGMCSRPVLDWVRLASAALCRIQWHTAARAVMEQHHWKGSILCKNIWLLKLNLVWMNWLKSPVIILSWSVFFFCS